MSGSNLKVFQISDVQEQMQKSKSYRNRCLRYILKVPRLTNGGEALIHPEDKSLLRKEGDRGVVFFNGADAIWQGVRGNGTEVIIITVQTVKEAETLYEQQHLTFGGNLTSLKQIKTFLDYARNTLALPDAYYQKLGKVGSSSDALSSVNPLIRRVNKEAEYFLVYIREPFCFRQGPIKEQRYPNGGFIGLSNGRYRAIAPEVVLHGYKRFEHGNEVAITSLKDEFPYAF